MKYFRYNGHWAFKGAVVVIFFIAGFLTSGMFWYQCSLCGVQEYERKLLGITIESYSEREYDEYGTYEEWKKINQKKKCDHDFSITDHSKIKKSLSELKKMNL